MWAPNNKKWLMIGLPFTFAVAGLILYLNLADAEVVEQPAHWDGEKTLYVCEAPDWVNGNLDEALELVKPEVQYAEVVKVQGSCLDHPDIMPCEYQVKGVTRRTVCAAGGAVITLADAGYKFGGVTEGGHGDEVLRPKGGVIDRATGLFPADLESVKALVTETQDGDVEFTEDDWPEDIEMLVVAHALVHIDGYDHVQTYLPGPFIAEPHGHLMARSMQKLGRNKIGIAK